MRILRLLGDGEPRPHGDDPRVFEPSAEVGCRLPHGWLPDRRSTLDLVDYDVPLLLTTGEHDDWAAAASALDAPLRHIRLTGDAQPDAAWFATCDLSDCAALLVRPDQHIAWRSDELDEPGPARLADAVRRTLLR